MKKLTRIDAPECLNQFNHGCDQWDDVPKEKVWEQLEQMQGGFCAYCECRLNRKHIEHFRTRNSHPQLTFEWSNLFASCGDSRKKGGWRRCGIYKDDGAGNYDISCIIKPDEEEPSNYLLFLTSGVIACQPDLNDSDKHKAEETIRVFNLNGDTSLFSRRKLAIQAIQPEVSGLYEMQDKLNEEEWAEFLQEGLDAVKGQEFQTALEQTWRFNREH